MDNIAGGEQQARLFDVDLGDVRLLALLLLLRAIPRLLAALLCPVSRDAAVPAVTLLLGC